MDPIRERELIMTRRHLFGRTSKGIGVMALASLLNPELFAAEARDPKTGGLVGPAALRAQGQARHLPASVRRAFADRSVRLQAEAGGACRHANCPTPSARASASPA